MVDCQYPANRLGPQVAGAGAVRAGRGRGHAVTLRAAQAVHGRDLAGGRHPHRPGLGALRRPWRPGLHGHADRDHQERPGRLARGQDPRRRALAGGGQAVARGHQGEDPARALFAGLLQRGLRSSPRAAATSSPHLLVGRPGFAPAAANAFAQAYMETSVDLRVDPARQSAVVPRRPDQDAARQPRAGPGPAVEVPAGQGHHRHRRAPRPGERAPQRAQRPALQAQTEHVETVPASATPAARRRPTCSPAPRCRASSRSWPRPRRG